MAAKGVRRAIEPASNHHRTSQSSEYTAKATFARRWRSYRRPDGVASPGTDGAKALRGFVDRANNQSRQWQREQFRRTGFATPQAELGHSIVLALRELGYPLTVAQAAGQLGAVATAYNWQGNNRVAQLIGRHKRTVQRARARLEAEGLIRSELLLTGDMLDGQRAPVRHPQVVRDVSALQRLARARDAARHVDPPRSQKRKRRRAGPSAAEVLAPVEPMTAADFAARGEAHPEFASHFAVLAAAAARREAAEAARRAPKDAATIKPGEIDDADRRTAELERQLRERQALQRERDPPLEPPERGPPRR